jgi:pimeloyl-ACP methyl ester carboxylesterase
MGGYTVRVYAHDYPEEVSGVVFIDPQNLSVSEVAAPKPAPKPGQTSLPALMARIGLARLLADPLGSIQNLPEGAKQAYTAYSVTTRGAQALADEFIGMSEGGAQARAVTTLGALPLIVLSRSKSMDADSAASQARYLQLSTDSLHLIADHSDHRIMIEQPEAAVAAILNMVEQVRK